MTESKRALQWVVGADTGTSSILIMSFMMGLKLPPPVNSPPYDRCDFGRCYRMLKKFPKWRGRMNSMSVVSGWDLIAARWGELTMSYEDDDNATFHKLIKSMHTYKVGICQIK